MRPLVIVIIAAVAIFTLANSMFIVSQVQMALVLQFGKPVNIIKEPGLKFKLPFVQDVVYFDNRLLEFDADPKEVITSDRKWVIVDAFVRYEITNPLLLRQTVGDEFGMRNRLAGIVDSSVRRVIGATSLNDLLSPKRTDIMRDLTKVVNTLASGGTIEDIADEVEAIDPEAIKDMTETIPEQAEKTAKREKGFGIEIVDVRLMRVDLPPENSQAIYRRMQTEREREAKEARARGEEESQRIRSRADRERTVMLAETERQSEILRGEGDAEATRIFAEAFSQDPEFFDFYRSMQAYRTTLGGENTRMILSPDSEYLRYLKEGEDAR